MRIAIIARPHSFHGGVEQATAGLLGALVARGEEVDLLTPGAAAPVPGVTVRRLRLPPLPAAGRVLALAAASARAMRSGRWDVVQSHERTLGQDVYRAGEGCHGAYLAALGSPRGRRIFHAITLALERRVFARTPRIVAIAARGVEEIRRWHGVPAERLSLVYNGVDLERFHPERGRPSRESRLRDVGVPAGSFAVLFVGSGFARKGLATAIEALAAGSAGVHLLVIGRGAPGPYEALAERRGVGDRVRWLGPRPDTERWYAVADAVVLPTRYEPFGNVHLEALASGVPVVASDRAGGAELIQDGVNGYVVDPLDATAVARALDRIRSGPPGAMAEAARRAALPFTHAAQAERFAGIYRSANPPVRADLPVGAPPERPARARKGPGFLRNRR
jgi:UDP-glucose:(heptosyl)LPS alpha-1,3-glucosyltransferase